MQTPPPSTVKINSSIWRAIAGAAVYIPAVNSFVHYFPQGHLEHISASTAAVDNHNFTQMRPWIYCQVTSVHFLADPASDQVLAKILLHPIQQPPPTTNVQSIVEEDDDIVSFAKILTQSDTNDGSSCRVPEFCVNNILPKLTFNVEPHIQNLMMLDTNKTNAWLFTHICLGTPRQHFLTTGWSSYVKAKQIVTGDTVVFMRKDSTNERLLGVRRSNRSRPIAGVDGAQAMSAIENAVSGTPFEVVYYPKVGLPDFVVMADKVEESLRISWGPGTRVRMATVKDGSPEMTWIHGVVNTAAKPATDPSIGYPWRMLEVSWEDESCSQKVTKVSPWEVECLSLPQDFRQNNVPSGGGKGTGTADPGHASSSSFKPVEGRFSNN